MKTIGEKGNREDASPVIMSIDFLRNPVFIPGRDVPSDFDGNLFVNGELKVSIKGPPLDGDAADVFHALTHRAREQNFANNKVSFVLNDLHKQLNLSRQGNSYSRVRKAIKSLYEVSVEMQGVNLKSGKFEGGWRILTARALYDNKDRKKGQGSQSWVKFSDEMLELFRSGALKAVHPIYFKLPEAIDRRLFALISVRASDLRSWEIPALTLRDLIPLLGKKYSTPSGVLQQLSRNLTRLQEFGVIKGFEVLKTDNKKEPLISIHPNSDFYISKNSPGRKLFSASEEPNKETDHTLTKLEDPIVKQLISHGVLPESAMEAVFSKENGAALAKLQLAHLSYLIKNAQEPRNPGGWLLEAIKKGYQMPSLTDLETPAEATDRATRSKLLNDAEFLHFQGKHELAAEKAREILALGASPKILTRVSKILNFVEKRASLG